MYIYFAYIYEVLYINYIMYHLYKSPGVKFKHMDVSYVSSIYNNGKNKCWTKNGKISVYLPLPGVTVLKNVMENLSEHTIKKIRSTSMDIWTLVNGLIYLMAFALFGWVLLDASKVSKK